MTIKSIRFRLDAPPSFLDRGVGGIWSGEILTDNQEVERKLLGKVVAKHNKNHMRVIAMYHSVSMMVLELNGP